MIFIFRDELMKEYYFVLHTVYIFATILSNLHNLPHIHLNCARLKSNSRPVSCIPPCPVSSIPDLTHQKQKVQGWLEEIVRDMDLNKV